MQAIGVNLSALSLRIFSRLPANPSALLFQGNIRDTFDTGISIRFRRLTHVYNGPTQIIQDGLWGVAPKNIPLATKGLYNCRGLVISDGKQNFIAHFLPHISADETVRIIEQAGKKYGLDLNNAQYTIMRGAYPLSENLAMIDSYTENEIRKGVLQVCPNANIDFVQPAGPYQRMPGTSGDGTGIAVVNGQICDYPEPKAMEVYPHQFEI